MLGTTDFIAPEDLPEAVNEGGQLSQHPTSSFYQTIAEFKKQLITEAIKQENGNYTKAAKRLGIHPNNLHRLLRNLNLKEPPDA